MAVAPERYEQQQDEQSGAWLETEDVTWFGPDELRPWAYRPYGSVMTAAPGRRHLRLVPDPVAASGHAVAEAGSGLVLPFPLLPVPTRPGQPVYRQARRGWSARRKRRFLGRFVPTATVLFSAAVALPWLSLRPGASAQKPARVVAAGTPLPTPATDPAATPANGAGSGRLEQAASAAGSTAISGTSPQGDGGRRSQDATRPAPARTANATPAAKERTAKKAPARRVQIAYKDAVAVGLPWAGSLVDGVGLPQRGPDWVTWDPAYDRSPNRAWRLYGTEELVRTVVRIAREYRRDHPDAPRVVIGDMSARGGGPLDQHASHQNGLDVDVYYPRLDHRLEHPTSVDQVDMRLAQDLVDRFVAAGAQFVFVGPNTPLVGPGGVVQKLANHDNHMHVRIYG